MSASPAPAQPFEDKPVLAAVDLSRHTFPCVKYGCEIASKLKQPLILAHVVHETAETAGMYRRYHGKNDTTPLTDIAYTMLEEHIRVFRETCGDLDRLDDVRLVAVPGIPATRIPELAERFDAGIIVLCSENRRTFSQWFHRSVAESVVRNTERPIVIIDSKGETLPPPDIQRPLPQAIAG
jgi:nucleotide-binding universal stress UspA family protein